MQADSDADSVRASFASEDEAFPSNVKGDVGPALGSVLWMAPEVAKQRMLLSSTYSSACDVFSCE